MTLRVTNIQAADVTAGQLIVTNISATSTAAAGGTLRITNILGAGYTLVVPGQLIVTQISAAGSVALQITPMPMQSVDAYDLVTVTAQTVDGTVPDSWVVTQTSGTAVPTISGPTVTFQAPPVIGGETDAFSFVAMYEGQPSQPQVFSCSVASHNSWSLADDGTWVGRHLSRPVTVTADRPYSPNAEYLVEVDLASEGTLGVH